MSRAIVTAERPQDWANRVRGHLGSAIESIIEAGRSLCEAKAALAHGEFERMFSDHEAPIRNPLPFSARTAQRLMKIASNAVLSKAAHAQSLPPSWMTLYELTKVPDSTLVKAISDGRVHPDMARSEVGLLTRKPTHASVFAGDFDPDDRCLFDIERALVAAGERLDRRGRSDLIKSAQALLIRYDSKWRSS